MYIGKAYVTLGADCEITWSFWFAF